MTQESDPATNPPREEPSPAAQPIATARPIAPVPPPPASNEPTPAPLAPHDSMQPLRPSVRIVWLVGNLVSASILSVVAVGIDSWLHEKLPVPFGVLAGIVALVAFVLALIHPTLRFKRYRYALRAADLVVEDGVWWRERICIPRPRIQHVDIDSGPVSRGLGLCQLSVFTAGATQAAARIDGIAPETAEQLRAALLAEPPHG